MSNYCEWPEFYYETFPKARKQYRCCECSAPIIIGEEHLHYRGKWGGKISSGRQHLLCRDACMHVRDEFQDGECIGFGELKSYWSSYPSEYGRPQKPHSLAMSDFRKIMTKILIRERHSKQVAN